MDKLIAFMPWIGSLLALACVAGALHNNSRKRLIQSLPTCKTDGVFVGLVELNGTAESEQPLRSHLAGVPCVHYAWNVEEEWQKDTTTTDQHGKTTTRHEQGWESVASGAETQSFYLKDSSGVVLVHPKGAKLEPLTVMDRTCGPGDPLYYAKGPMQGVSHSTQQRRFTERAFALHEPVFIIGKARERDDTVAPEIAQDKTAELFLISSRGERKVVSGYRAAAIALSILGVLVLLGMLAWWDALQGRHWQARALFYGSAVLGYVGLSMLGWAWSIYNGLIRLRNRVMQGLSLVDIQLQRRHELIPNLVRVMDAFRNHEQRVQIQVAALRQQAGTMQALKPALAGLQEAYPQLKADQNFLDLQQEIAATENRIALARDYFNNIATHYNTSLEQFPDSAVAALAMVKAQPLLAEGDFERAAVRVQFAD